MSPAIGMVGLGEAGSAIAADLVAAGASVRGWDPVAARPGRRRSRRATPPDAAAGAEIVLSANSAAVALDVGASPSRPPCARARCFADLNTAAPALKRELADGRRPDAAPCSPTWP